MSPISSWDTPLQNVIDTLIKSFIIIKYQSGKNELIKTGKYIRKLQNSNWKKLKR